MKSDNKDAVNFKIKDFRRHVAKKRSAIAAVALLFIPIFILTVFVTGCYSMDQKKSAPSHMTSNVITDYDANQYATVKIGTQIWMTENLRSLHYSDGTKIKEVYTYDDDDEKYFYLRKIIYLGSRCKQEWDLPQRVAYTNRR